MLRVTFAFLLSIQVLMAYSSRAINAYVVSIYDEQMTEEPLQGVQKKLQKIITVWYIRKSTPLEHSYTINLT